MPVNHTINPDWVELNLTAKNLQRFSGDLKVSKIHRTEHQENQNEAAEDGKRSPHKGLEGPDKICLGKTVFKRTGHGNKFYRDYYTIYHRGKKFGVAMANSRDHRLMPVDNIQLQVSNNKLYEVGWLDDLKEMMSLGELSYKSACRLDIAIDGGEFFRVFEAWEADQIDKVGRAKITKHMTGKGKLEGYYIGMSKSKKRLICYDKTAEFKRSNKLYIERFWERSGLIIDGHVQRLELRLKNEESKKIINFDWQQLDNTQHLASMMQTNLDGFFEWCEKGKDKNITRRKRINPINWDELGAEYLDKDSTRPTSELWAGKVTMKKLWEIYYVTGRQMWFDMAYEIAVNVDAVKWLNSMQEHWKKDLEGKLGNNKDGVISDAWVTKFKEYGLNEQINIFEKDESDEGNYSRAKVRS